MAVYGLDDSDLDEFLESESSASESGSPALHLALRPTAAQALQPLLTTVSLRAPDSSDVSGPAQDACRITPANRWDADTGWEAERTQAPKRFGSFIQDAELFDADLFGSPQQEASAMDPQQRLLLEGCWDALSYSTRASELTGDAAKGVAVTVGISYTEYYLNYRHQGLTAYTATSGTLSVVCGRLSFTLGLKGPSISIDTACSSSLVGAHIACTSFLSESCQRALVCGVNLTMRAETTAVLAKAGMLASDGRCKTLDSSADGYMRGEACVVHLLEAKSPQSASKDQDGHALVIRGTSVNQDGRSSSLTVNTSPPMSYQSERTIRAPFKPQMRAKYALNDPKPSSILLR